MKRKGGTEHGRQEGRDGGRVALPRHGGQGVLKILFGKIMVFQVYSLKLFLYKLTTENGGWGKFFMK